MNYSNSRSRNLLNSLKILLIVVTFLSCGDELCINLGGPYRVIISASFNDLTIVKDNNIVVVGSHILDYAFDADFVTAANRPRDPFIGIGLNIDESDEAFNNSSFRQYWIIDKTANKTYGPFQRKEFLRMCSSLKVPEKLTLKDTTKMLVNHEFRGYDKKLMQGSH